MTQDSNSFNDNLLEDLFESYFKARKNKRNKKDQIVFEENYESNIFGIYEDIINRKFKADNYTSFVNKRPVIREVFAPSFRDRVVHHLLYKYLSEIYEPYFINDSYSCRKNKGTLYGIYRLKDMIYSCSHGYKGDCYILKLDISGYFYNINKKILYKLCTSHMKKYFSEEKYDLMDYLLKSILFDDIVKGVTKIGNRSDWKYVRRDRSLFYSLENVGLPIGNLTSQLFSNIYMNSFDHFIKYDLNIKHYGRYVDDFVIVHKNKEFLKKLKKTSENFLKQTLELEVHPKKVHLQHYSHGVQFLGAFIKPNRVYVTKRIKNNFNNLIININKFFTQKNQKDLFFWD